MRDRPTGWTPLFLVLLLAAACGDDTPSDEDLIERFIEDVTGDVDDAYVGRALGYVDMARFPLDVRVPHHAGVYAEDRAPEIVDHFKRAIRQYFHGTELKLRSDEVEITGNRAEVKLGLMTAVGPLGARITLQKAGEGVWKVSRVHVDR
jgi:hypothetical protein